MNKLPRDALRAAVLIHEQLVPHDQPTSTVHLPDHSWAASQRLQHRIARARGQGWHRAARRLSQEMAGRLRYCRIELDSVLQALELPGTPHVRSTPCEIYQDLLALRAEFDEVEIDVDAHELRVTTDAIVLGDVDLGRFDICLDWQQLGGPHPYRIVARDPYPARTRDDVPHPHVQDETLCEGEGRAAIRGALAQGRLQDFILLVSRVLHTYARGNAYVELADWSGATCGECGTTMSADDAHGCQRCGSELCEDCRRFCAVCDESFCSGCLSSCPECEADVCRDCLKVCPGCRRRICDHCLEDALCPSCQESQSPEEEEDHDADQHSTVRPQGQPPAQADVGPHAQDAQQTDGLASAAEDEPHTAAQPDRLGQALVPA